MEKRRPEGPRGADVPVSSETLDLALRESFAHLDVPADPDRLLDMAQDVLGFAAEREERVLSSPGRMGFGPEDPRSVTVFSRFWISPLEAVSCDADLARTMAERMRDALRLLEVLVMSDHGGTGSIRSPVTVRPFRKSPKNGNWYSEINVECVLG